jgi:ferrous iron transport protein B
MAVLMHASDLGVVLTQAFTPLSAFSFMVFCLLYVPCISAFVSIKREMNSWRWALGTALFSTGVAYIVSLVIYQVGSLLIY